VEELCGNNYVPKQNQKIGKPIKVLIWDLKIWKT
jgi:hypothetical protein